MNLLGHLRKHIIDSPLRIEEKDLNVWVEEGSLKFTTGSQNNGFLVEYTGIVYLEDYSTSVQAIGPLMLLLIQWLKAKQSGQFNMDQPPIRMETDPLKHDSTNLLFSIDIKEYFRASQDAQGNISLHSDGVDPIDPVKLSATEWTVYLQGDPDPLGTFTTQG